MKKWIALFFFVIITLSQTEVHQLLRLPILFEHYSEHKAQNGALTFSDFLLMHYASSNHKDADHQRDSQLPFKSHECPATINMHTLFVEQHAINIEIPAVQEVEITNFYVAIIPDSHLSDIWQPPKLS